MLKMTKHISKRVSKLTFSWYILILPQILEFEVVFDLFLVILLQSTNTKLSKALIVDDDNAKNDLNTLVKEFLS